MRWGPAVLLAVVVAAGCSSAPEPADGPQVVVPGRPGEAARVLSGEEAAQRRAPVPVSPADVVFVERMIPHHEQALEMAALAPERAESPQVRSLAERISAAQGPEIEVMRAWLERQADELVSGGGHGGHGGGHGDMPGMATPEQLEALATARGAEFDRLFVELMTVHHQGAIDMAEEVITAGTDITVAEIATDVAVTQAVEIDRMAEILTG